MTAATLNKMDIIWKGKAMKLPSKIRLMRPVVHFVFIDAYETWTLTAELEKRVQALEIRYFRRFLDISYKDHHVANEEVRNRIKKDIGPYEDLLSAMKRRQLRWFGHVARGGRLVKTVLQRTARRGRKRRRQKKRWGDNNAEWT